MRQLLLLDGSEIKEILHHVVHLLRNDRLPASRATMLRSERLYQWIPRCDILRPLDDTSHMDDGYVPDSEPDLHRQLDVLQDVGIIQLILEI